MVTGDLAHNEGKPGDYDAFVGLMQPLREAVGSPCISRWEIMTIGRRLPQLARGWILTLLEEKKPVEKTCVLGLERPHALGAGLAGSGECVTPGLLDPRSSAGWIAPWVRNLGQTHAGDDAP